MYSVLPKIEKMQFLILPNVASSVCCNVEKHNTKYVCSIHTSLKFLKLFHFSIFRALCNDYNCYHHFESIFKDYYLAATNYENA